MIEICLVVAASDNNVIGRESDLPWHLPADLALFKKITLSHPMIMGRKTFESIGRVLPGRKTIVLTNNRHWSFDGVDVVNGIEQATDVSFEHAKNLSVNKVFVVGGGEIYKRFFSTANRVYMTRVHASIDGDTFFPEMNKDCWHLVSTEKYEADSNNQYDFTFTEYERRESN